MIPLAFTCVLFCVFFALAKRRRADGAPPTLLRQVRKVGISLEKRKALSFLESFDDEPATVLDWVTSQTIMRVVYFFIRNGPLSWFRGPKPDMLHPHSERELIHIPSGDGKRTISVHVYRPKHVKAENQPKGLVLCFHGGGMTIGSAYNDEFAMALLNEENLPFVLASVEYRLAPEHVFPAALDDCEAALRFFASEKGSKMVGIDRSRIVIAGCSAGGGLAAAVAQTARNESIKLLGQLLVVPMLELPSTWSYERFRDNPGLSKSDMLFFWRSYFGLDLFSGDISSVTFDNERSCPLRGDANDLAPAFIYVSSRDVLRAEGEMYYEKLARANVPVFFHRGRGTHVGSLFLDAGGGSIARKAAAAFFTL